MGQASTLGRKRTQPGEAVSSAPSVESGARQLVQHCLGLQPNQQLVILLDETTVETGVAIAGAAESLGVSHTAILVPVSLQRQIPLRHDLSLLAQGAAREARAILTCLNPSPECLPFRRYILETHWTARTRIGHMPGASLEVLKLAAVDVQQLVADCATVEAALVRGRKLDLVSYTDSGAPHTLTANIGGWDRLPVASDGVIRDGAWGNVPSGETYIAPIEGSATGTVAINGSIPGLVVQPETNIVLHFARGHLTHIQPDGGPAARWLHETQIARAQAAGDPNWSNLAEIGVGLNPAVEHLTGNMLFDEKAAGTAHIALGTNAFMGGVVSASIHCDMVTRSPTILVDGKTVLDRGLLAFKSSEWHENHVRVSLDDSPLRTAQSVARSGIQASGTADGRLQRVLRPEPGRVSACFVGDRETARFAYALYAFMPDEGDWLPVEDLAAVTDLQPDFVRRLLHVMWRYDLIRVR
jgi:leucyl aminopeptidase (aminopeptidase T)